MPKKLKNYSINYMETKEALDIFNKIRLIFPNPHCELNFNNPFELLVATILSAQATDKSVNLVTPILFSKYPNPYLLSAAKEEDVEEIIKSVGLGKSKSRNIINLSKILVEKYDGKVNPSYEILTTLPGVGRKTANVVLAEAFDIPRIGVDTHVKRVCLRLGLSSSDDLITIEEDLMKLYPKDLWKDVHLTLLFFGRYLCKSKNPDCDKCPFYKTNICKYRK